MRRLWVVLCLACLLLAIQRSRAEDELHPTKEWVDFVGMGASTLGGQPVPVGAVIRAYDPSGTLAGRAEVVVSGYYLMHVYGDDSTTELDEGAVSGDTITFTINDQPAIPQGPDSPVWVGSGTRQDVELEADACILFGDLDGDGDVDVADAMAVAGRWRCQLGDSCYDGQFDLDGDGDIDVVDIMLVSAHWGETCSP